MILTPRLRLRPLTDGDVPVITELGGAREVAATTIRIPHPYGEDDARRFVRGCAEGIAAERAWVLGVVRQSDDAFLGCAGLELDRAQGTAELGYWIGVPHWGHGYATEAAAGLIRFGFETLGVARIHAHHFAGNEASGRVLQKIGMSREGCLRRHVVKWGERHDIVYYGMLREELESR